MKTAIFAAVALGFLFVALRWSAQSAGDTATETETETKTAAAQPDAGRNISPAGYDLTKPDSAALRAAIANLKPIQCDIMLHKDTERAFTGKLLENKAEGVYACALCGLPLFKSTTKFDSGTGWPSFYDTFADKHVLYQKDTTYGITQTEILCGRCGAHLGHIFGDGPAPTGKRYCVNSAALEFLTPDKVPPPDVPPTKDAASAKADAPANVQVAYFAGGCFWGVEDRFQQVPGVIDAVSGYQGGHTDSPSYKQVCTDRTGHAESVKVTFDADKVTYPELLAWFFKFHDPTQVNRQGPDYGTQYRSAIFAADDEQFAQANAFIAAQAKTDRFRGRPIATKVEHYMPFYKAEGYHQDYHKKHGGSCPLPTN